MTEYQLNKACLTMTGKCNFNCEYCYLDKDFKELSTSQWLEFIDVLSNYENIKYIQLTGGEPFVRKDFLKILEKCSSIFQSIVVMTNGSLIGEKESNKLSEFNNVKLFVSLDTVDCTLFDNIVGQKGACKRVLNAIKLLQKKNVPLIIQSASSNVEQFKRLPQLKEYIKKNKLNWRKYGGLVLTENETVEDLDLISKLYVKKHIKDLKKNQKNVKKISYMPFCGAGFTSFGVLENGDITPCLVTRDSRYIAGNILVDNFMDIADSSPIFKDWREKFCVTDEECKTCKFSDKCLYGCPLRRDRLSKVLNIELSKDIENCALYSYIEKISSDKELSLYS